MHSDPRLVPQVHHTIPPLNFLEFGEANPKLWIHICETYFDLYNVPNLYNSVDSHGKT